MTRDDAMGRALRRVLGDGADDVQVRWLPAGGGDRYELTEEAGSLVIHATSPATALVGLRAALLAQGEPFDEILAAGTGVRVRPQTGMSAASTLPHRFYGNDTEDAYVGPYRSFADWERQIDALAARGFTEVFTPVGVEAVYIDVLMRHGYTEQEARAWVPLPTHQPWWLLQNMAAYPGGLSAELVARRAEIGRAVVTRMRELELRPVVPGYSGMVPRDFGQRHPTIVPMVPENPWQGFDRPAWLDPAHEAYAAIAADYYAAVERVLGDVDMFKMDLLHEGGEAGAVDVTRAARRIQQAMLAACPGSIWVMLGWQANPPREVLAGTDPAHVLIVDGLSDRHDHLDRERDFPRTDYAFGTIWNFGGDTALGAQLATWNTRYDAWRDRAGSRLRGIAAMPEGGFNNPFAMDFFTGLAWEGGGRDLDEWVVSWVRRRYGSAVPGAVAAWREVMSTAYALPDDNDFSEPHDSLFAAAPSFDVMTSSSFSPREATYDLERFASALRPLLDAADEIGGHRAYRFDLADIARQAVTNSARQLLPALRRAHAHSEARRYDELTALWLRAMGLLDDIAGTQPLWLLGRLLDEARAAASTPAEAIVLERSQRLLLTTWGPEVPATVGGLSDYAGRDMQGLIRTFYIPRWEEFFRAQHPTAPVGIERDASAWWERDQEWVQSTDRSGIRSSIAGDPLALSRSALALLADIESARH